MKQIIANIIDKYINAAGPIYIEDIEKARKKRRPIRNFWLSDDFADFSDSTYLHEFHTY